MRSEWGRLVPVARAAFDSTSEIRAMRDATDAAPLTHIKLGHEESVPSDLEESQTSDAAQMRSGS